MVSIQVEEDAEDGGSDTEVEVTYLKKYKQGYVLVPSQKYSELKRKLFKLLPPVSIRRGVHVFNEDDLENVKHVSVR